MRPSTFLTQLTLLLAWAALPAAAQTSEGSAQGSLSRRLDYYLDYQSTTTAAGTQYSHVFILLSRGVPDSLRPPEDTAVGNAEQRACDSVARSTSGSSVSIPFGGHWYLAISSGDTLSVLGQRHALAGGDSVLVVMVDRADHVGGAPIVAGIVTLRGPLPAGFWTSGTDPIRQARVLTAWLRRSPRARAFLR